MAEVVGYLCMYKKNDNPEHSWFLTAAYSMYDSFQDYKEDGNTKEGLEKIYYLLKCFDKLCDLIRDHAIYIADNGFVDEEEI